VDVAVIGNQLCGRILIIDDDPAAVLLLITFLADVATEVRSVTESKLAERAVYDFEPDLVLLDLHMPEPDGREILRRLRGTRACLGFLPVIVLTADTSRLARNSALLLGANDFLTKPLDRTEVILRVRNLLHTRQLYVDLASLNQSGGSGRRGRTRGAPGI
jgi:DNA-binding response OmpR family regulator